MTNMHDLVAPYLLGSLDDDEHRAFEGHLKECRQCREELVELEPAIAQLAAANAVAPPDELRGRILSGLDGDGAEVPAQAGSAADVRTRTRWSKFLIPSAAVLIVVVGAFAIFGSNPIDDILNAPDATTVALATSDAYQGPPPATAQVTFSPGTESAVVRIDGLADPSGTNVYELWLIGADGPIPAGTFVPGSDGTILIQVDGAAQPGLVVGITEEPDGGSPAPTGDVLFSAEL